MQQTSLESYEQVKNKLSSRHQEVLDSLEDFQREGKNATDYEITIYLEQTDPNYVRPRRYELVNKYKLVGFSEKRICSVTGKKALAWKLLKRKFN